MRGHLNRELESEALDHLWREKVPQDKVAILVSSDNVVPRGGDSGDSMSHGAESGNKITSFALSAELLPIWLKGFEFGIVTHQTIASNSFPKHLPNNMQHVRYLTMPHC